MKSVDGCTDIIPGFHKHLGEWWARVVKRIKQSDGHVHGIDKICEEEDAASFGNFTPVPCHFCHLAKPKKTEGERVERLERLNKDLHVANKALRKENRDLQSNVATLQREVNDWLEKARLTQPVTAFLVRFLRTSQASLASVVKSLSLSGTIFVNEVGSLRKHCIQSWAL